MRKQCVRVVWLLAVLALIPAAGAFGAWNALSDPALIGWWACNEGAGALVADSSANGNDGTIVYGDPAWGPGVYDSSVMLLAPVVVEVPAVNLTLSEATMAGWFMPYGAQPDWASIIMHRFSTGPVHAHGFNLLATGGLAYHWNDSSATWSFRPDAQYSATEWTFCALTVAPDKATFYVNGEAKAENVAAHEPAIWDGPFYLGGDGTDAWVSRRMNGSLDDVSLFGRALNADEIMAIMGGLSVAAQAGWEDAAMTGEPAFIATNVADGVYDIGALGGEITYEFVVQSNPEETQASMALIGRRDAAELNAGLKYEQWNNTGTYGATLFGVADYDFGVANAPGVPTHLVFVASATTNTTALYVNGVYQASVDAAILLSGMVGIGYGAQNRADADPFFDDFDGEILGVAIFDRALPANEIKGHADAFALQLTAYDVTTPGDEVVGIPSGLPCGGSPTANYSPCGELPPLVIDNSSATKYLNFGGNFDPNELPSGFTVAPSIGATVVTGITFTTANDAPERDPISFELYGSNESIDGPFELIAGDFIMDFAMADAWPRFTMNATPVTFENETAYKYYKVLFTMLRDSGAANSMQIAEVELIGLPLMPKPPVFVEDFEAYEAGTDLHGVAGWKGWGGTASASAPVSDAQAFSGTKSVEVVGTADLVHEFAIDGGVVEFSAMQFIPSGTTGTTYFILMNQYDDPGAALDWSVQTEFRLADGIVHFWTGDETPIVFDQWVEVKHVIDLDNNTIDYYYNGTLVSSGQWDDTAHTTLQAIDLYGNNASSVYYDDIVVK